MRRGVEEAQRLVAGRVRLTPLRADGGLGVGVVARVVGGRWWACAAVVRRPDFRVVEEASARLEGPPRYVAGLRGVFEAEGLVRALRGLRERGGVVFVRGHGISHPRRCGLACHVGVAVGRPTVGCAERLLWGRAGEPGPGRGEWAPVLDEEGRVMGAAVRMREGVRPVYVSPGHRCDVEGAVAAALRWGVCFRWPEPLRAARRVEVG